MTAALPCFARPDGPALFFGPEAEGFLVGNCFASAWHDHKQDDDELKTMANSGRRPSRRDLRKPSTRYRERKLEENLTPDLLGRLFDDIRYGCYGKHKSNPYVYGVEPYRGQDSDCSLCDDDAGFVKDDMRRIPALFERSKKAGLVGTLLWTVDDNGWIYELQVSNVTLNEWHGYPLLTNDTFARKVWDRFSDWAGQKGSQSDREAAQLSAKFYGFKR